MPKHVHIKFRHAFPHGLPFRIHERSFVISPLPKMTCLLRPRCLAARSCEGLKLEARVNATTGPSPQTSTATQTISIKQQHCLVLKSPCSTASRYIGSAYILFAICWDLWNFESNPDVGFLEWIAGIHQPAPEYPGRVSTNRRIRSRKVRGRRVLHVSKYPLILRSLLG
jgi:hypothetical protein